MLPDVIENQVIEIKDALIENGIKDGLHTATECVVDIGKSISGIFTGKFENISQVQTAIGSGGVIDTFSDLIDKASNKIYQKGIINSQIKSVITGGKDIILNNVTSNIKNEMNFQERSIHNIGKYVDNFNEYLKSKDFEGMTKEWKKIQNNLKSIIPLENILKQVRQIENIYNLIKNNGNNFELSQEELEIIKKIIAVGPIMIGIYCGIEYMLWGSVVISFIAYFLNSYYSAGLIDYPAIDQLKDILPTFLTSLTVAFIMWCVSLLDWSVYLLLPIQLVLGILLAFFIYEKIKLPEYLELKQLGISLLKRK